MGLEEILKQVEETGKEKAAAIRKETVEEVENKMKEATSESKDLVSQIESGTSRRIEQLKQQEIPAAELEVKKKSIRDAKRFTFSDKVQSYGKIRGFKF